MKITIYALETNVFPLKLFTALLLLSIDGEYRLTIKLLIVQNKMSGKYRKITHKIVFRLHRSVEALQRFSEEWNRAQTEFAKTFLPNFHKHWQFISKIGFPYKLFPVYWNWWLVTAYKHVNKIKLWWLYKCPKCSQKIQNAHAHSVLINTIPQWCSALPR